MLLTIKLEQQILTGIFIDQRGCVATLPLTLLQFCSHLSNFPISMCSLQGRTMSFLSLDPQNSVQGLGHIRYSIDTWWMKERMNELVGDTLGDLEQIT